eukprot:5843748-Prymnesium_polylepis.1
MCAFVQRFVRRSLVATDPDEQLPECACRRGADAECGCCCVCAVLAAAMCCAGTASSFLGSVLSRAALSL